MEIVRFDRGDKAIGRHGSAGARATRVAAGAGEVSVVCLAVEPGGLIGTHPAASAQLFLVIAGQGWVAGPGGERVAVSAGTAVRWEAGEAHTCGSDTGLTALAVEAGSLEVFGRGLGG